MDSGYIGRQLVVTRRMLSINILRSWPICIGFKSYAKPKFKRFQQDMKDNFEFLKDVRAFVVDDDQMLSFSVEAELKSHGAIVMCVGSIQSAIKNMPNFAPDIVISDIRLPDGLGLELLKKWRHEYPNLPIILMTAHPAVDSAITALRLGAVDYIAKPFDIKSLVAAVKRAAEISSLKKKLERLSGAPSQKSTFEIVGTSELMRQTYKRIEKIAKSKIDTVLILGESGTGKELAARAIHQLSDNALAPFIEINCASIPESLLESELFGYERGAFTDAKERKLGLFEIAGPGTIFLDEIGELPFKLQAKLLRAIEYRRFKRLGGNHDIEFQGRVVAATNRNLVDRIYNKEFRKDLYFRLNILPIQMPKLIDHLEDLPLLTNFFIEKLCIQLEIKEKKISSKAIKKLREHHWPGNVRELRNVMMRALILSEGQLIEDHHIELDEFMEQKKNSELVVTTPELQSENHNNQANSLGFIFPEQGIDLEKFEKELLLLALKKAANNQTKAAKLLNISRHTLRYRLEKHNISSDEIVNRS